MLKVRIQQLWLFFVTMLLLVVPVSANVTVTFLDVGQGDATWIHDDTGYDVLVDAGDGVINVQQATQVRHWNATLWTHAHDDHISGMLDVLGAVPVDRVYWNGFHHDTITFNDLMELTLTHKVPMQVLRRGETLTWGECTALVLHPDRDYDRDNNDSVVLRLSDGQVNILLTGDAEEDAEEAMLASGLSLDADVLKVGHHGSDTSSSAAFLATVSPEVAIISVGQNGYGHPSQVVLDRLSAAGARVLRTDINGTLVVVSDGRTFTVEATPSSGRAYLPWVMGRAQATPMPSATLTPTRTGTPTPSPTPTMTPVPMPTNVPCPCDSNTLNCADFDTQAEAQACFEYCQSLGRGDVHRLDADHDGIACENLP